jgi:2-amino-4-hydroxy-6-hydroxymethyldihydropteridine diphosphokinase
MHSVYLLLGSNLGDRLQYIKQATRQIENQIAPVIKKSSVYETASWGKTDAPDYLNQVIELYTDVTPRAILQLILNIEKKSGRIRGEKWDARTIDIDILFYGQLVINEEGLQIPHPALHTRRFTLEPLAEIAPGLIHPSLNVSILSLKDKLKDNLHVKKLQEESKLR